jgi:hypothetical protein
LNKTVFAENLRGQVRFVAGAADGRLDLTLLQQLEKTLAGDASSVFPLKRDVIVPSTQVFIAGYLFQSENST